MSFGQDGQLVRDFDKSEYDFLRRYGRTPDEVMAENAKLRELASELWVSCPVHDSDCDECKHKGGRTGCELYDRMRELGVMCE